MARKKKSFGVYRHNKDKVYAAHVRGSRRRKTSVKVEIERSPSGFYAEACWAGGNTWRRLSRKSFRKVRDTRDGNLLLHRCQHGTGSSPTAAARDALRRLSKVTR